MEPEDRPSRKDRCSAVNQREAAGASSRPLDANDVGEHYRQMRLENVVPGAGIEPAHLSVGDFESPASTNFTTRAGF